MAKFSIIKGKNDQFYFNLKANNGEKILQSEGYSAKSGAENGISSVRKNADDDDRYERKTSSDGKQYFVLKAGNGEIIGTSETYNSEQGMENGIAAVKRDAPGAGNEDLT